ncbi:Thioredoxin-like protein HCF164, chloroplastic [Coccomyxa sp. Obi]|nr:Thioredoxin-like protein HCF164, chloroplastic [Coccomyxa sp. Obi]
MDGGPAIERLRSRSMPLEAALTNRRPTVLEFYADWCEVCNELAPMTLQVEEEYKDRVNFVMLNVENTKWAPEAAEYGVRGIPHFVFLNEKGSPEAAAVGRLPREVLEADVRALAASDPLPFRNNRGPTSGLARPESSTATQKNPRDHS